MAGAFRVGSPWLSPRQQITLTGQSRPNTSHRPSTSHFRGSQTARPPPSREFVVTTKAKGSQGSITARGAQIRDATRFSRPQTHSGPRGGSQKGKNEDAEQPLHTLYNKFEENWGKVSSAFHSLDKNGDGTLSESELHEALARFHVPVSQLQMQRMMQHFDEDGNGMVSYPEFSEGLRKLMEGKIMASQMGVKASNPLFLVTGDPFAAGKLPHMQQTCVGDTMAQLRADPKRAQEMGFQAPSKMGFQCGGEDPVQAQEAFTGPTAGLTAAQRGTFLLRQRSSVRSATTPSVPILRQHPSGPWDRGAAQGPRHRRVAQGGGSTLGTTPGGPATQPSARRRARGATGILGLARRQPNGTTVKAPREGGGSAFLKPPTPSRSCRILGAEGTGMLQHISGLNEKIEKYHGLSPAEANTFCSKPCLDVMVYT